MKINFLKDGVLFQRWSYTVPLLCYITFFCMIWMLSVPLRPNLTVHSQVKRQKLLSESEFDIKLKNSNFDSDKKEEELLNEKNEYLVNVNDRENIHKDQSQILWDVFKK